MSDLSQLKVPEQKRPDGLDDDVRLRWVPGWEEMYAVTDDGRLWSAPRETATGGLKSPHTDSKGYEVASLSKSGDVTWKRVHSLVLQSFRGPRPDGHVCRHLNGDPADNRIENLKWGTYSENEKDKARHGTSSAGESNGRAKLEEADVVAMRKEHADGKSVSKISKDYGLSKCQVYRIAHGYNWPDAGGPIAGEDYENPRGNKLNKEKVRQIRNEAVNTDKTMKEIAEMYGVTSSAISGVVNGRRWPNARGPIKGKDYQ